MSRTMGLAVVLLIGISGPLVAADRPGEIPTVEAPADKVDRTAADLQAMQGRWTREFTNRQGATFRNEKTIDGNRDSVTEFDANGNAIYSHSATFKLLVEGRVRVFTFSNFVVTGGPNLGAQVPGTGAFVYKLDGDTLYEVWGLAEGDRRPPMIYVWKRAK